MSDDSSSPQNERPSNTSEGGFVPPRQKEWYVNHGGQQQGPWDFAELINEIKSGRIQRTDLCWKQGMPQWKALREIDEVRAVFPEESPVKEAVLRALAASKIILLNPVGGLRPAYEGLKPSESISASGVFFLAYELLWFLALLLSKSRIPVEIPLGFNFYMSFLAGVALPFVALIFSTVVVRFVGKGAQSFHADLFIASASLLPLSMVAFLASILGPLNLEITLVVALFGGCFSILILYAGFERIHRMSEAAAALCVPAAIAAAALICKIIAASVVDQLFMESIMEGF